MSWSGHSARERPAWTHSHLLHLRCTHEFRQPSQSAFISCFLMDVDSTDVAALVVDLQGRSRNCPCRSSTILKTLSLFSFMRKCQEHVRQPLKSEFLFGHLLLSDKKKTDWRARVLFVHGLFPKGHSISTPHSLVVCPPRRRCRVANYRLMQYGIAAHDFGRILQCRGLEISAIALYNRGVAHMCVVKPVKTMFRRSLQEQTECGAK